MESVWILRSVRRQKRMGRGAAAEIRPEILVLHLGRIGGETALGAMGTESLVIQEEGKWSSGAFVVYARFNLEHGRGVSRALAAKSLGSSRQQGKGQGVGRSMWPLNGGCAV